MSDAQPTPSPETPDELRGMIHDLNGDIFLIRTCCEILLKDEAKNGGRLLDYLNKISDRTQRMEVTVKNLRRFKESRGL